MKSVQKRGVKGIFSELLIGEAYVYHIDISFDLNNFFKKE